jgi:hypothetical protein
VEQLIDGPDGPQVVTMTSAEIAELEAARGDTSGLKRPKPPLEFKELFTLPERKAMRAAARENEDLEDFLDLLNAAGEVHIDDPRVVAGLNAFVSAGILTAARRGEIADSF